MERLDKNKLMKNIRMYTKKEYEGLSQEQKDRHCVNVVKNILDNSKEGITISLIEQLIPYLGKKKIERVLDKLINTNYGYKKLYGRTYAYYPNGKLMHEKIKKENIPIGNKLYSFYHLENNEGNFVFIQEKSKNELNAVDISGGLLIDAKQFDSFLEQIKDFKNKVNGNKGEIYV